MIRGTSRGKQMAVAPVGLYQIACQDWGQQEGMPSILASTWVQHKRPAAPNRL